MKRNLKAGLTKGLILLFACLSLSNTAKAQVFENILWTADVGPDYTAIGGNYDSLFLQSNQIPKRDVKIPVPGNTITNVKWHPNGHLLAISKQVHLVDGGVMILDIRTMNTLKLEGIPSTGARAIGWNPSGELLAVGDNEGDLHIFDKSYALVKKVDTGLRSITSLSWHPDKTVITMVSGKIGNYNLDTDELQVWNSRKEEMLLLAVAWHPSGDFFALGDYGDSSRQYPAQLQFHRPDGSLIKTMLGSKAEYRNILWSEDGNTLASVSDAFRLWDRSGELLTTLPFEHKLWGLSFDKKHNHWLVTDETGQVFMISEDGTKRVTKITPFKGRQ